MKSFNIPRAAIVNDDLCHAKCQWLIDKGVWFYKPYCSAFNKHLNVINENIKKYTIQDCKRCVECKKFEEDLNKPNDDGFYAY